MSMMRGFSWIVMAAALSGVPACASTAGSAVARGQRFNAGRPDYDRFFASMYSLQLTMASAPGELVDARRRLTDAVVLRDNASASVLAEQLRVELDRVGSHAGRVRVELLAPDSPDLSKTRAVVSAPVKPHSTEAKFLGTVEGSLTRLLRLNAAMKRAREELGGLCNNALALESQIDTAFPSRGQHAEVLENLRDAERVIALMIARADETAKPTDEFLGKFAIATGASFKSPSLPHPSESAAAPERVARSAPVAQPAPRVAAARPAEAHPAEPARPAPAAQKPAVALEPVTRADFDP